MNGEERNVTATSLHPSGGEGSFERSENEPSPPPSPAGDGSPPTPPPAAPPAGGLDPNDPWEEDPWPRVPQPTDEGAVPSDSPAVGYIASPNLKARRKGTYASPAARPVMPMSPQQRLLLLDTWQRSGLPARDFGALVNISRHTLYAWKRRFEQLGPAGLTQETRGARPGSKLPDLTKRTILMLKQAHPDWGCERISDMLMRGPALPACANAVARVLREAGYELVEQPTRPHPDHVRSFERATPNQLWQTDLFTKSQT